MTLVDRFFIWTERRSEGELLGGIVAATFAIWAGFAVCAWLVLS